MGVKGYRELNVWQRSLDLADHIYSLTEHYPKTELYGLAQQIRRCAVSVPSNIAEGSARNSSADFIRFLHISKGSLAELNTQLLLSGRRNYISQADYEKIEKEIAEIDNMLFGLIRSIKTKAAA